MRSTFPRALVVSAAFLLLAAALPAQSVYPTGTTIWLQGQTEDGYTLFAERGGSVVLIDMDGTVVNTWSSPIPGHDLTRIDALQNGHILGYSHDPGLPGRLRRDAFELDYFGNVVWSYSMDPGVPPLTVFHHDSERLGNGNTLLLASQLITVPHISPRELRDDFLIEVSPGGQIVWGWQTWQHFFEFGFDPAQKALISKQGADWAHTNTISVIPPNSHTGPAFAEGNIILSQRYTNTIFIIDKATKAIVWRIGPDEPHLTHGQHYPHMIEQGLPGAGNILVFDNGSGTGYAARDRAPGQSTVKEIDPVTKTVVWQYGDDKRFWSDVISGAQRLSNGNTLICSGVKGRLFEVDSAGTIVWEDMSPFSVQHGRGKDHRVYRAYRLPYAWKP